jgi:hypothetical protein
MGQMEVTGEVLAALGYDDAERAAALLRGAKGKRLLYQWPREAAHG